MTLIAIIALILLFVAVVAVRRLLSMSDAEIKRELNKDAPIDMIERQNELKRRRMKQYGKHKNK